MSALVPNRFIWLKSILLTSINALDAYGCQSRRMLIPWIVTGFRSIWTGKCDRNHHPPKIPA